MNDGEGQDCKHHQETEVVPSCNQRRKECASIDAGCEKNWCVDLNKEAYGEVRNTWDHGKSLILLVKPLPSLLSLSKFQLTNIS